MSLSLPFFLRQECDKSHISPCSLFLIMSLSALLWKRSVCLFSPSDVIVLYLSSVSWHWEESCDVFSHTLKIISYNILAICSWKTRLSAKPHPLRLGSTLRLSGPNTLRILWPEPEPVHSVTTLCLHLSAAALSEPRARPGEWEKLGDVFYSPWYPSVKLLLMGSFIQVQEESQTAY